MAHRPMPKPDTAGRTSPVQRPPLPILAPDQSQPETNLLSLAASKDVSKSRRDYWAFAFATLLIAAMLVLGWRIGKIVWGGSSLIQKQSLGSKLSGAAVRQPASPKTVLGIRLLDKKPKAAPNASLNTSHAKIPANSNSKVPQSSASSSHKKVQNKVAAGPVVVRALVGRDGKVEVAQVIRGAAKLRTAALAMVRQLSFNPYAPHGTPVEFETEVTVSEAGVRGSGDGIQFSIPRKTENPQSATAPIAVEKPSK
ncbi:MAG: energy transducer TonB [Candidatus Angelobacter sp.]